MVLLMAHSRGTRPQSLGCEWRRRRPEQERCQELSFEPWLHAGEAHVCGGCQRGWISVAKTFEGLGNIARHGEFDRAFDVVPLKMESTELGPGPIDGDGAVIVEGGDEKVGSELANTLDAKVIDNESKHDWFGGANKETGGVAGLNKTSGGELAHELLVGQCWKCWKMCASTTMASLKFPLQDSLQQVASSNTTIISSKLICCNIHQ